MYFSFNNNEFIPIFENIFKKYYNYNSDLNEIHTMINTSYMTEDNIIYLSKIHTIGKDDRNSVFIKNYHNFIDRNPIFFETYHKFIIEYIKPLFPEEEKIVIQKTPNLRISLPLLTAIGKREEDPIDIIGLHSDSEFGHHSEEINFIIPITDMFDTNSIYYEPIQDSNTKYNEYLNLILNKNQFFMEKFNKLKHYNKINTTNKTRISLDLRVIPYSKYMENIDFFNGTKFELNNYYITI